jgi:hypothetical protein
MKTLRMTYQHRCRECGEVGCRCQVGDERVILCAHDFAALMIARMPCRGVYNQDPVRGEKK